MPRYRRPGVDGDGRHGRGEVRLARVERRRREHGKTAREHLLHLVACPPHGRGRGDEHGPDRAARAQPVDRGLVQAHHRAEGVADQVQLVLDDQVRWPQPHRRLDHAARQVRPCRMAARSAERREIGILPPVPRAFGVHQPEQGCGRCLPRQLRQLVHRGDHQAGRQPVDLLVHGEHRQTLVGRVPRRERAVPLGVRAVHQHPPPQPAGLHVGRRQPRPAPRAHRQLQHAAQHPFRATRLGDLPFGLLEGVRRHRRADPKTDPERRRAPPRVPGVDPLPAQHLARAHQRRGPLELLRRQQPQRVPHQHRDPARPVIGVRTRPDHALQPPDRERVRREPQVRLGLTATGREEQELHFRVRRIAKPPVCVGMRRIGQPRQAQQHERELERPPRPVLRHVQAAQQPGHVRAGRRHPRPHHLRPHALQRHRLVREPERLPRDPVGPQQLDRPFQAAGHVTRRRHGTLPRVPVPGDLRIRFHPGSLLGQPLPVPGHQRPQRPHQVIASQLRRPEPRHVEHQAWHLPRHDELHLRRREARRGQLPRPRLAVAHGSVDRALPPVRVHARRPVQQLQVQPLIVRPRQRRRDVRVVVPEEDRRVHRPARSRSAPPGTAAPCPGSSPASAAR